MKYETLPVELHILDPEKQQRVKMHLSTKIEAQKSNPVLGIHVPKWLSQLAAHPIISTVNNNNNQLDAMRGKIMSVTLHHYCQLVPISSFLPSLVPKSIAFGAHIVRFVS